MIQYITTLAITQNKSMPCVHSRPNKQIKHSIMYWKSHVRTRNNADDVIGGEQFTAYTDGILLW